MQLSLEEVLGAQVLGLGSLKHSESRDRTLSEEFREIRSKPVETPSPSTKCLGWNQFVVRGL